MPDAFAGAARSRLASSQNPGVILCRLFRDGSFVDSRPALPFLRGQGVLAERLGFNQDEALSLGKALAGLNAQSKGRRLGIFKPTPKELKKVRERERGEEFQVELLGPALLAVNTDQGVRAAAKAGTIAPETVERYLESKFGEALPEARKAMMELANALDPDEQAEQGFSLYEQFRP